jgi:hypothetical protein
MKKRGIIILLAAILLIGSNLKSFAAIQEIKKQEKSVNKTENTSVTIGDDKLVIEKVDSSTNVRVGNRNIAILESLEGPKLKVDKIESAEVSNWNDQEKEDHWHFRKNRFRGHWAGLELGFNNYLTSAGKLGLPDDIDYMNLHSSKSMNFNLNFSQISLGVTRRIGFVTGLGLNWNNYVFDGNNNITKGSNGVIEMKDPGVELEKSKLTTLYLTLPFMLEFQIPAENHFINLGAGPIGALKLGSHSKMKYETGQKVKDYGDFSLNMLRYGLTARAGYKNFHIYGTYYMTPLFQSGKGPGGYDLYPFEVGIALTFND